MRCFIVVDIDDAVLGDCLRRRNQEFNGLVNVVVRGYGVMSTRHVQHRCGQVSVCQSLSLSSCGTRC